MMFEVAKNCSHLERDAHFRVLVDGAAYFDELAQAFEQAEHTIFIAGWTIDPRVWLRPDAPPGQRLPLQAFLRRLVSAKPRLTVYLLIWDMSETYRLATNTWGYFQKGWLPHPRIRLVYDEHYPFGGALHQKYVVVDDTLAFCGGIDLTTGRWDTPEHLPRDPRRIDAYGIEHKPMHDLQVRLQGASAAYLSSLFRQRWLAISRRRSFSVLARQTPFDLPAPDTATHIALSRTDPSTHPPTREIRELFLDLIQAAQKFIYIENQYLTSRELGHALAERLQDPNGPEVIIIGPREPSGWVEEITVGILRWRVVDILRAADRHGRLRIMYAMASVKDDIDIYVHAKLMIVDDIFVRIGSSNVSRRSLTIDAEIDVTAHVSPEFARDLREKLHAEFLGIPLEHVQEFLRQNPSICALLDQFAGKQDRTLVPLGKGPSLPERAFAQDGDVLFDPAEPWGLASLAEVFVGRQAGRNILKNAPAGYITIALVCALISIWRLYLFDDLAFLHDQILAQRDFAQQHALGAALIYIALAGIGLSIGMSTFVVTLPAFGLFGPVGGATLAWSAEMIGAFLAYFWGQKFGRNTATKLLGVRVQEVRRRLFGRGFFSVLALQALPISSFATVGFAAGAGQVNRRAYIAGTAFGVIPNLTVLGIVAISVTEFIKTPNSATFLTMVLSIVFLGALTRALIAAVERRENLKQRGVPGPYSRLK